MVVDAVVVSTDFVVGTADVVSVGVSLVVGTSDDGGGAEDVLDVTGAVSVFPVCSGKNAPLANNITMDAMVMVAQCRFIGAAPFFSRFSWTSHQIPGRAIASPASRLKRKSPLVIPPIIRIAPNPTARKASAFFQNGCWRGGFGFGGGGVTADGLR